MNTSTEVPSKPQIHFRNLRQYLDLLGRPGELHEINIPVDPELEITEIYDRVVKKEGPALFFKNVRGSSIPLVINLFGSQKRINSVLGVGDINEAVARIQDFLESKPPQTLLEKLAFIPKLKQLDSLNTQTVSHGASQEVVLTDGPMLDLLPVQKCWPKDGGRFITFPLVITRDPETGKRNVGLYRMHVYDNRTTGMHWQLH